MLHTDNWRRYYRGAYLDSYLDGDVATERLTVWTERLSGDAQDRFTLVADDEGVVVGFVHAILDDDPTWGAYLENLHVRHDRHGEASGKLWSSRARASSCNCGRDPASTYGSLSRTSRRRRSTRQSAGCSRDESCAVHSRVAGRLRG
jgi:hypothetical protein